MPEQPRRGATGRPGRPQSGRGDRSGVGNLVGAGPSIVGISGALRARDVSRAGEDHDALAEQTVVVRRREPLPADAPPRPTAPHRAAPPSSVEPPPAQT